MSSDLLEAINHDMTDIVKGLEEQGLQVLAWFGLGYAMEVKDEANEEVRNTKDLDENKVKVESKVHDDGTQDEKDILKKQMDEKKFLKNEGRVLGALQESILKDPALADPDREHESEKSAKHYGRGEAIGHPERGIAAENPSPLRATAGAFWKSHEAEAEATDPEEDSELKLIAEDASEVDELRPAEVIAKSVYAEDDSENNPESPPGQEAKLCQGKPQMENKYEDENDHEKYNYEMKNDKMEDVKMEDDKDDDDKVKNENTEDDDDENDKFEEECKDTTTAAFITTFNPTVIRTTHVAFNSTNNVATPSAKGAGEVQYAPTPELQEGLKDPALTNNYLAMDAADADKISEDKKFGKIATELHYSEIAYAEDIAYSEDATIGKDAATDAAMDAATDAATDAARKPWDTGPFRRTGEASKVFDPGVSPTFINYSVRSVTSSTWQLKAEK